MDNPNNNMLVPRDEFDTRLPVYAAETPFLPSCIGKINPYTGQRVNNESDYDEYIRERLFHLMCEEAYQRKHMKYIVRIRRQTFILFACILAVLFFFVFPHIKENAYNAGETAGYDSGYSDGQTSGYDSGYSDGETAAYNSGMQNAYLSGYADALIDSSKTNSKYSGNTTDNSVIDSSVIVYVTNSGSKYHTAGCSYLKSSNAITLSQAKAKGYTPCSRCHPPT